jgi:hypothetical protein
MLNCLLKLRRVKMWLNVIENQRVTFIRQGFGGLPAFALRAMAGKKGRKDESAQGSLDLQPAFLQVVLTR